MKSAFFWSFLTNYLGIVINFVSVVVLARMLTPSEVGTYAIAGAIFAIAQIFRDMGISGYLLREKTLTRNKVIGALTIVWILCTSISVTLFICSTPLATFYALPELNIILQILCLNIFLIPLGTIAQTFLRRDMNFKVLGGIELISQAIHLIVAITLAYHSFGATSLALASLSATVCTLALVNIAYRNQESYFPSVKEVKAVLPFISMIGFANILTTLNSRATPLIIGKAINENAVAIMDKALATIELLNQLLMQAIQKVLLPFFTKIREQKGDVKQGYLTVTNYTLLVAFPFLFYVAVLAEFVVLTLFGQQWTAAIPLVPIFAIASSLSMTVRFFNEVTISMGLEKVLMKLNLSVFFTKVTLLILLSPHGLEAIALGLLAMSVVRTFVIKLLIRKYVGIGFREYWLEIKNTFAITIVCTAPYFIGKYLGYKFNALPEVTALSIAVAITWALGIFIFKHKARYEISLIMRKLRNGT